MILDKLVVLQNKTTTFDTEGIATDVWTANNTTIWVNIQDSGGKTLINEYSNNIVAYEYVIFTKVNDNIQKNSRIVDGNDSYDVERVKKPGRVNKQHCELLCNAV